MTASISLRGVGRTFGATRALADVDLDLEPGVIGLLGPNGAGKTTPPRNSPGASRRSGTRRPNLRRPAIAWWLDRTPSAAGFSGTCTTGSSRRS
jgi:ABC-type hemin transport system ATPase subunit